MSYSLDLPYKRQSGSSPPPPPPHDGPRLMRNARAPTGEATRGRRAVEELRLRRSGRARQAKVAKEAAAEAPGQEAVWARAAVARPAWPQRAAEAQT